MSYFNKVFISLIYFISLLNFTCAQEIKEKDKPLQIFREAQILMSEFKFQEAIKQLQQIPHSDSIQSKAQYSKGVCHIQLGHYNKAQGIFIELFKQDSTQSGVINQLALLSSKQHDFKQAFLYKRLLSSFDTNNTYFLRQAGEMAMKAKLFPDAQYYFQKSLKKDSHDIISLIALGSLFQKEKQLVAADSIYHIAIQQDSNNIKVLNKLMGVLFDLKKFDQALHYARKSYRIDPENINTLNVLAISCYQTHRYQQSNYWLNKVILDLEKGVETHFYYQGLNYAALGQYKEADLAFEQAISAAISPNIKQYYAQLGLVAEERNDFGKAIQSFSQALFYGSNNNVRYKLASIYDQYYADENPAINWYQAFITYADEKSNPILVEFSKSRIKYLKEKQHFED